MSAFGQKQTLGIRTAALNLTPSATLFDAAPRQRQRDIRPQLLKSRLK